ADGPGADHEVARAAGLSHLGPLPPGRMDVSPGRSRAARHPSRRRAASGDARFLRSSRVARLDLPGERPARRLDEPARFPDPDPLKLPRLVGRAPEEPAMSSGIDRDVFLSRVSGALGRRGTVAPPAPAPAVEESIVRTVSHAQDLPSTFAHA